MPHDKKKKATERLQQYSTSGKMPRAGLSEYWKRLKKVRKLEADRAAAAKKRETRGSTTQDQLRARQEATRKKPRQPTQSEIAAGRREGVMGNVPGYKALVDVLTPKKKKEED